MINLFICAEQFKSFDRFAITFLLVIDREMTKIGIKSEFSGQVQPYGLLLDLGLLKII